jgi:osmotically inducible lipoprotein OsmB
MKRSVLALVMGAVLLVSACGSGTGDRAASGAGIGAGVGAVVGAVTGLSILQGVLIGAAAGGLTGALTDKDVINLGDPIWASKDRQANNTAVMRVQAGLRQLGYEPGPIDGRPGPQTTAAIRAYQRDNGLLQDGNPTVELAAHMDQRLQTARR